MKYIEENDNECTMNRFMNDAPANKFVGLLQVREYRASFMVLNLDPEKYKKPKKVKIKSLST